MRWDYGDPALGTCKETVEGGNHFRYWAQDGPQANRCGSFAPFLFICVVKVLMGSHSGAIFMGVSYELPIARK